MEIYSPFWNLLLRRRAKVSFRRKFIARIARIVRRKDRKQGDNYCNLIGLRLIVKSTLTEPLKESEISTRRILNSLERRCATKGRERAHDTSSGTTIRVISILLARTRWLTLFPYPSPVLLQSSTLLPRTWSFRFLPCSPTPGKRNVDVPCRARNHLGIGRSVSKGRRHLLEREIVEEIPGNPVGKRIDTTASILGPGVNRWETNRFDGRISRIRPFSRNPLDSGYRKHPREKNISFLYLGNVFVTHYFSFSYETLLKKKIVCTRIRLFQRDCFTECLARIDTISNYF